MSEHTATSESGSTAIDRPHPPPTATWTIDPADSSVTLTWRKLRLWTVTGRLRCLGVVHLDDPPPVGVIRFQQPSGLPVLTMALDPASIQTHNADLDTSLRSSEVFDVLRHRWWTLCSDSLEILPTGTWRVMTTLTANGTAGSVELRLEVDPAASSPDWLVLKGHGQLDRRAFGIGRPVSTFSPQVRLDLAVRARRVGEPTSALRVQGIPEKPTARDRSGGIQLTNRHAEVAAQIPMHRVAARTGTHPSAVGTTAEPQLRSGATGACRSRSTRPIRTRPRWPGA
jgi:polyisoprenoid-binding protein YceI